MKKRTMAAAMVLTLLMGGTTAFAEFNEPTVHEGGGTDPMESSERHAYEADVWRDQIRSGALEEGEHLLADGKISVYVLGGKKEIDVQVVDQDAVEIVAVHVDTDYGFNCFISKDGLGSSGIYGRLNEFGKLQEIREVSVYYRTKAVSVPDCEHNDTEMVVTVPIPPLEQQNGDNVLFANGNVDVEFNGDGYVNITPLGKENNVVYVHGKEHYDTSGMGVIKVPIDGLSEITLFVNTMGDRLPDMHPQHPDEEKQPVLLPNTGLGIAVGTVVGGLGLVGAGVVINKKRK